MDTRAAIERRATFVLAERSGTIDGQLAPAEEPEDQFEALEATTAPAWRRLLDAEPARVAGFVTAALVLAISFGVPISVEQKAAILGFIAAGFALVQAEATRAAVYSPATVEEIEHEADHAIEAAYVAGVEDADSGLVTVAEVG